MEKMSNPPEKGDKGLTPPSISLPKGGGAIKGIGEKFAANPVTGTGSMTVPIATSPGRSGFGPQLSLSYDSGSGNGPFGFGWSLSLPSITRKTDKGLPKYIDAEESDEFILSGAEDLVPVLIKNSNKWEREILPDRELNGETFKIQRYRPRIEGLFARIEKWTNIMDSNDVIWRSISKDNITTWYGKTDKSRIQYEENGVNKIFSWLICQSYDDKGNAIVYEYEPENNNGIDFSQVNEKNRIRSTNRYIKRIKYGNLKPNRDNDWKPTDPAQLNDWLFEVIFDFNDGQYESIRFDPGKPESDQHHYVNVSIAGKANVNGREWPARKDAFSSYRSGFEVRTHRLCQRVLMFHHFNELPVKDYLVRSTEFIYNESKVASFITSVIQSGYQWVENNKYLKKSLPSIDFEYSQVELSTDIETLEDDSFENLPVGINGRQYQLIDLDGEGLSGILSEQANVWFYKPNLGDGHFGCLETVATKPSPGSLSGGQQLLDLAGDGQLDLVSFQSPLPGFFERTIDEDWEPFKTFKTIPNINWNDPNLKFVDLNGDGHADILITEDDVFTCYPSLAEDGYADAFRVRKAFDEEKGPALVFNDGTQSVYLSDMSGDGLNDLVRIRNGEICYWPNLGYGHFGSKVTMDNSPVFDYPDQFSQDRIRLADIDGSGNTDIIYIKDDGVHIYLNESGNSWKNGEKLKSFPLCDNLSTVMAADLLGNGTACLLWSSPLPGTASQSLKYISLMGYSFCFTDGSIKNLIAEGLTNNIVEKLKTIQYQILENQVLFENKLTEVLGKEEFYRNYDLLFKNADKTGIKPHLLKRVVNNLGAETHVFYTSSTKFYLKDKSDDNPWITKIPFPVHVVEKVETYDKISNNRFVTRYAYHHGYFDGFEREFRGFGMVEQWDTEEYDILIKSFLPVGLNIESTSHVPPVHTKTWFHTGVYLDGTKISKQFEEEYFKEPGLSTDELEKLLLSDTVLPDKLSLDEECEACRAMKGSILRQEIYADDNSAKSGIPYSVSERNYTINNVQPTGPNKHAVFFVHPRETIDYHYERNSNDPRISHQLTLEVDDFGNIKKSVSVGYGRRQNQVDIIKQKINNNDPDFKGIKENDLLKQINILITYSEAEFTAPIDKPVNDPNYNAENYRSPLPSEVKTFELTGYKLVNKNRFEVIDFIKIENEKIALICDEEIHYEQTADITKKQKRLIEQVKTLYRKNDLTEFLKSGELESMALPGESYKLALTPGLLNTIFNIKLEDGSWQNLIPDPGTLLGGKAGDQGGYVDLGKDGNWWIPSGRIFYDVNANVSNPTNTANIELTTAKNNFFLPCKFANPFNQSTQIDYDASKLLMTSVTDAILSKIEAQNDYRVLQPFFVIDPNKNCTKVKFDALGMVAGTAVMGKVDNNGDSKEGDSLKNFEPNLTQFQLEEFMKNPREADLNTPNESKASQITYNLLCDATTRIVYDLKCYKKSGKPPYAATIARETHYRDLKAGEQSKLQVSFSYSDGFGREIQKKIQAEAGKTPKRDANGVIIVKPDGLPEWTDKEIRPRWVGSGWTIFNNKGKPVRQFEPFFSDTHLFDPDTKIGVSPVLFYDPLDRVIATLHPNHTYEKVVFDAWMQKTYDVNDTITLDPRTDPDIAGYVKEFFKIEAPNPTDWKTWLQERNIDPNNPPPDTPNLDPEKMAAVRSLIHGDTPTAAFLDNLGRTFLTIAINRCRRKVNGNITYPPEEIHATRVELDIEGNQRIIRDALDRDVMVYQYDMLSNPCSSDSIDAGKRWMLKNVAGNNLCQWNIRDNITTLINTNYDALQRQTKLLVMHDNNPELHHEYVIYGETHPKAQKLNLKGKVFMNLDSAGLMVNYNDETDKSYDFKGNLLHNYRKLAKEYKTTPDWISLESILFTTPLNLNQINTEIDKLTENSKFETSISYDALNRPVQSVLPDNTNMKSVFNEANLLDKIEAQIQGKGNFKSYVQNINYNAKGQRDYILYGNNTVTYYTYDYKTYRLSRLFTKKTEASPDDQHLQDLKYTYDPVGNIIKIQDDAQQIHYFANAVVEPHGLYEYDSIYRLIAATGREHAGLGGNSQPCEFDFPYNAEIPHRNDANALRNYTENYVYDFVGNIREMIHKNGQGTIWHRKYWYDATGSASPPTNRLFSNSMQGDPDNGPFSATYTHDKHGNMVKMPHLGYLKWDFKDQLQEVDLMGGGKAWYVYDAAGQRVRKVIERNGGKREQRIYLGNVELYLIGQDYKNSDLQRWTTFISDDKGKITQIDTKTLDKNNEDKANPLDVSLVRYQYTNHLGSAMLETNEAGNVISYEEYHPYGTTAYRSSQSDVDLSLKRYRYSGKERDEETGLYYYGARYYVSWLGRWCSCDPIGLLDNINLFVYENMNPIRYKDSLGTQCDDLSDAEISAQVCSEDLHNLDYTEDQFTNNSSIPSMSSLDIGTAASASVVVPKGVKDTLRAESRKAAIEDLKESVESGIYSEESLYTAERYTPDQLINISEGEDVPEGMQNSHLSSISEDPAFADRAGVLTDELDHLHGHHGGDYSQNPGEFANPDWESRPEVEELFGENSMQIVEAETPEGMNYLGMTEETYVANEVPESVEVEITETTVKPNIEPTPSLSGRIMTGASIALTALTILGILLMAYGISKEEEQKEYFRQNYPICNTEIGCKVFYDPDTEQTWVEPNIEVL
jgi:RHS repeat-associated protein